VVITLIGYRGTGKSTIGPRLAARLGWDFLDADPEIERRAGRSIREIFETDGEPAFRSLEAEILQEFLTKDRLVLAPGGGAVLNPATRDRMRAAGPVVWLTAPGGVILDRLNRDATTAARRPALTELTPQEEIARLLAQREPVYSQAATITIDTVGYDLDALVEAILNRLPAGIAAIGPAEDRR
jgi:shikimate kinase